MVALPRKSVSFLRHELLTRKNTRRSAISPGVDDRHAVNLGRWPALDGLRGVAVILVFISHSLRGGPIAYMGWLGVDLFFALSGFLITSIILRAREAENYYKVFYARRALRILPLYYLADATITLAWRTASGQPFWQAHRRHFYQRAIERGLTVSEVIVRVFFVNLALAALAFSTLATPDLAWLALVAAAAIVAWLLATLVRGKR